MIQIDGVARFFYTIPSPFLSATPFNPHQARVAFPGHNPGNIVLRSTRKDVPDAGRRRNSRLDKNFDWRLSTTLETTVSFIISILVVCN